MRIQVEENPNCGGTEQFEYRELGPIRLIKAIRASEQGTEALVEVVGVGEGPAWEGARCVKIADSGAGFAFFIFGGAWGLRLKPVWHKASWDLSDPKQWGEPFKIYGSEDDIVYV